MTNNDSWRRYLEAGAAVGQVTLARAEEIAKGLVGARQGEREAAWREFEQLTRFGRRIGEQLVETARAEVSRQLETLGAGSLEQFLERFSEFFGSPSAEGPARQDGSNHQPGTSEHRVTPLETGGGGTAKTEKSPRHGDGKKTKSKSEKKDDAKKKRRASHGGKGKAAGTAKFERAGSQKHGTVKKSTVKKSTLSSPRSSRAGRVLTMAQPPEPPGSL